MTAAKVRNNSYNGRGVGGRGGERCGDKEVRGKGGRGWKDGGGAGVGEAGDSTFRFPYQFFFRRTSEQHTATNHVI